MTFKNFNDTVIKKIDELQSKMGAAFLEILLDRIDVLDTNGEQIDTLYGYEYNLSRSRHWDIQQENYIMYNGFTDKHIDELAKDLEEVILYGGKLILYFEGISDLDEPVHDNLTLEIESLD